MDGVSSGAASAAANMAEDDEAVKKTVMVLAATNRPQDLDEDPLLRLEFQVCVLYFGSLTFDA